MHMGVTCNHFLTILHPPLVCVVVCGRWQLVPEGRHFIMIGEGTAPLPPKPMLDLGLSEGKVWEAYKGGGCCCKTVYDYLEK